MLTEKGGGGVRSEWPEVRPQQELPRWTNKSNAAPCLIWPTVHRAVCVNKIMGLISAGLSAGSRQRNSEESLLLSLLLLSSVLLFLCPLAHDGRVFLFVFCVCYWVGVVSDEVLTLFLRFFLTRYTWKVLFWNVLVNKEAYAAASVLMASQKRGWAAEMRSGSFSPGPSMIWWHKGQVFHHQQQTEWQLAVIYILKWNMSISASSEHLKLKKLRYKKNKTHCWQSDRQAAISLCHPASWVKQNKSGGLL